MAHPLFSQTRLLVWQQDVLHCVRMVYLSAGQVLGLKQARLRFADVNFFGKRRKLHGRVFGLKRPN